MPALGCLLCLDLVGWRPRPPHPQGRTLLARGGCGGEKPPGRRGRRPLRTIFRFSATYYARNRVFLIRRGRIHPARGVCGGAGFHDLGNLNFTFLVPAEDYDVARQLAVIAEACRSLGIGTETSGRNDLLADGR